MHSVFAFVPDTFCKNQIVDINVRRMAWVEIVHSNFPSLQNPQYEAWKCLVSTPTTKF